VISSGNRPFELLRYLAIAGTLLFALVGPFLTVCRATDPNLCGGSGVCWIDIGDLGCAEDVSMADACGNTVESETCACSSSCCDGTPVFHSIPASNPLRLECRETFVILRNLCDRDLSGTADCCGRPSHLQRPPDIDRLQSQRTTILLI